MRAKDKDRIKKAGRSEFFIQKPTLAQVKIAHAAPYKAEPITNPWIE
jgi:hypothetical protein